MVLQLAVFGQYLLLEVRYLALKLVCNLQNLLLVDLYLLADLAVFETLDDFDFVG